MTHSATEKNQIVNRVYENIQTIKELLYLTHCVALQSILK